MPKGMKKYLTRRKRARRRPLKKFILYCEGKNTEPAYFKALSQHFRGAIIEIEILGGYGVPYTIAQIAAGRANDLGIAPRSHKKKDSFELGDQIWAIFDRDKHPRFQDAIVLCEANNVQVATSNPCFELWLILHIEDFNRPDDSDMVQRHFEIICPEYDRNSGKKPNCAELIKYHIDAEGRANNLLTRRVEEGDRLGTPSTTVGLLTLNIREAAQENKRDR